MPEESLPSGGAVTREKLIEAAGLIFAAKGLHGTRIRDITDLAEANVAAVNYHFHDKLELYTLVLRQAHEAATAAMVQPLTADTPEGRIRQLLEASLTAALDPERPRWHTQLLARELIEPTPALERVHRDFQRPSHRLRDAIREMLPHLSEQDASLIACSIIAQAIFYVHHRHLLRRMFPTLAEPAAETLVAHVVDFSLAALRGMQVDKQESASKRRGKRPRSAGRARRRNAD